MPYDALMGDVTFQDKKLARMILAAPQADQQGLAIGTTFKKLEDQEVGEHWITLARQLRQEFREVQENSVPVRGQLQDVIEAAVSEGEGPYLRS